MPDVEDLNSSDWCALRMSSLHHLYKVIECLRRQLAGGCSNTRDALTVAVSDAERGVALHGGTQRCGMECLVCS